MLSLKLPRTSSTCANSSTDWSRVLCRTTDAPSDKKAARDLSYNPEQHQKTNTKHVARRHCFVRDMVESFELQVPLVGTADSCSDFFTKALDTKSFFRFRNVLMNEEVDLADVLDLVKRASSL